MKVSDVGETGLLKRIGERLPALPEGEVGSGDDAASLDHFGGRFLISTDMLVEGVDFDLSYATGSDVGYKAVAVNVSDIAAMGGAPRDVVVSVGLPGYLELDLFDDLLTGLLEACGRFSTRLVGGDISEASELVVSVTVTGTCDRPVLRRGTVAGDALCVTGALGGSAAGLMLLRSGERETAPALVLRHLRPTARVAEGAALASLGATSMIDISDGFGIDVTRLMSASGTGCVIDPDALPLEQGLDAVVDDPVETALTGGEDFELLVTLPHTAVARATDTLEEFGTALTRIGEVTTGKIMFGDAPLEGRDLGWEHLRSR